MQLVGLGLVFYSMRRNGGVRMANQPDYDYLLKLENWSKKDAALIVCGFAPLGYKSVRFSQKNVPAELRK